MAEDSLEKVKERRTKGSLTVTQEEARRYQQELKLPDAALGSTRRTSRKRAESQAENAEESD